MRIPVLAALLVGCSSPVIVVIPPDSTDTGSTDTSAVDTGSPAVDTGELDSSAPSDTGSSDTGADVGPETAPDVAADVGDAEAAADAEPVVMWATPFVVRPPGDGVFDNTTGSWSGLNAHLKAGQVVWGLRKLPTTSVWRSWAATIHLSTGLLSCPETTVQLRMQWNCESFSCGGDTTTNVKVKKLSGDPPFDAEIWGTFGGIAPKAMAGQPEPRVTFTLSHYGAAGGLDCGTLQAAPGLLTLSTGLPPG